MAGSEVSLSLVTDGQGRVLVNVVPPAEGPSARKCISAVVDVSYSMHSAANEKGDELVRYFSKLDIVKHGASCEKNIFYQPVPVAEALLLVLALRSGNSCSLLHVTFDFCTPTIPARSQNRNEYQLTKLPPPRSNAPGTAGLKTVVAGLQDDDTLSVVAFSTEARVVLPPVRLDARGREQALRAIDSLTPGGGTNLWDGLRLGLDQLRSVSDEGALPVLLLLTDGDPSSSPPEGEARRPTPRGTSLHAYRAPPHSPSRPVPPQMLTGVPNLTPLSLSPLRAQVGSYLTYIDRHGLGAVTLFAFGFGYDGAHAAADRAPPRPDFAAAYSPLSSSPTALNKTQRPTILPPQ